MLAGGVCVSPTQSSLTAFKPHPESVMTSEFAHVPGRRRSFELPATVGPDFAKQREGCLLASAERTAYMQMATKDDKPGLEKSGYEEGGSSSRIRITLTSQEVAPLEKGAVSSKIVTLSLNHAARHSLFEGTMWFQAQCVPCSLSGCKR